MILDKELIFSWNQEVTLQTANASTDYVDLTKAGDAIDGLWLEILVTDDATSNGGATVAFSLQTDNDSAFGSATTLISTAALAYAGLDEGVKVLQTKIPMGVERYLRVVYTVGTAALTGGKFSAYLTPGVDKLS